MSSHNDFRFSLAKKRAGIYFNDGSCSYSVQMDRGHPPEERLVEAIKAARTEFNRVYLAKPEEPEDNLCPHIAVDLEGNCMDCGMEKAR
jgi:hypothetical protein